MNSPFSGMGLRGLCSMLKRHFWPFSYSSCIITWLRTLDLEFCGCVSAAVTRGRRCPWPRTGFRATWSGGRRRSSTSPSTTSRTGTRLVWIFFASLPSTRFPSAGLSAAHFCTAWLLDWRLVAKWARLLITQLTAAYPTQWRSKHKEVWAGLKQ